MNNARKILVPTDLSENSRLGLRFAFSLVRANCVDILVLHVAANFLAWEIPDELTFFEPRFLSWEADRIKGEACLDLERFLERQRDEFRQDFVVRKRVALGPVTEAILHVSYQESVDLIVMSPRPHGAVRRLFSRSITDRITREAPCPVLSVCPPRTQRPEHGTIIPLFGGIPQGSRA